MYKVELTGNYNIYVGDLNFEFTPIKNSKVFSDDEFEGSNDIKPFLGEYLSFKKQGDVKESKKETTVQVVNTVVHEVAPATDVKHDDSVINATDASRISAPTNNDKTLEEMKHEPTDEILKADGASVNSVKNDVVAQENPNMDEQLVETAADDKAKTKNKLKSKPNKANDNKSKNKK